MEYKLLICDDEELHLDILEENLDNYFNFKKLNYVCERATSGKEAVEKFEQQHFNVVFLDIEIPDINGIEVCNHIMNINKDIIIIFVTSHIHYRKDAFEQFAFNYIVKPIDINKFSKIMDKALEKLKYISYYKNAHRKITLKTSNKIITLYYRQILYFESKGKKSLVFTMNKEYFVINHSFKELENLLDERFFFRCHRGYIINIKKIVKFNTKLIQLEGLSKDIPIGRKYNKKVFEIINKEL